MAKALFLWCDPRNLPALLCSGKSPPTQEKSDAKWCSGSGCCPLLLHGRVWQKIFIHFSPGMLLKEKHPRGAWVTVPAAVPRGEAICSEGQEENGSLPAELAEPVAWTEPSLFPTLRPPWPPSFPVVTSEPVHFASRFDTTD